MSVTNGPRRGLMINAVTGDGFDSDFRKLLRAIDALLFCSVINLTTSAAPSTPANGDAYVVKATGVGAWSGHDNAIAIWTTDNPGTPSGLWEFYAPGNGMIIFNVATTALYAWSGTAWASLGGSVGSSTLAGDSDVTITSPANNDVLTYETSSSLWKNKPAAASAPGLHQFGRACYVRITGNAVYTTLGTDKTVMNTVFTSSIAPGSTHWNPSAELKSTTLDQLAGYFASPLADFRFGHNLKAQFDCYISQLTDVRMWCGLVVGGTVNASWGGATDNPATATAGKYAAFRFSSVAGDTNYKCITGDGSAQNVVDSGVAADTNEHVFTIEMNDSGSPSVSFYIDGVFVGSSSSNLPGSGTNCSWYMGAGPHTAASVLFGFCGVTVWD